MEASQKAQKMKARKISDTLVLIIGVLLFLVSYKFDSQINLLFKNLKFPIFDAVLGIITNFGFVVLVIVLIPCLVIYKKNKKLVYLLWLTFIASFVLSFVIKLIVLRQRPVEAFTYPFTHIINYSFPSMHSMVVFSLLPALIRYLPKQKSFWAGFAFLVAFSRIYFGFHFLSDVVFGILLGYLVGDYLLNLYDRQKLWK